MLFCMVIHVMKNAENFPKKKRKILPEKLMFYLKKWSNVSMAEHKQKNSQNLKKYF